jgi:hypothetical protein
MALFTATLCVPWVLQAAKLKDSGDKPELEEELKDWDKGKISDSEMMLDIEEGVSDGGVDPELLHEGETSKEMAEMLEMDTKDHEDVDGADVPMPAAEVEEEVEEEMTGEEKGEGEEVGEENTEVDSTA